ncbi:uncharacterized protein LOC114293847 [Camellia sinensis]|uniref:uncharacterized protein LOC114293847 n=1 Tax=Camellia sinensis TaxID=4442 RepID=UPI001036D254|nr:uncharacterized protein LOC114293847 [Camellia sinensis]
MVMNLGVWLNFFYESLTPQIREFVEMMSNGEFLNKDPEEAFRYFDLLAKNAQSSDTTEPLTNSNKTNSSTILGSGKYHLKDDDDLSARLAGLTRRLEAMELKKFNEITTLAKIGNVFGICEAMGHLTYECPTIPTFKEIEHVKSITTLCSGKIIHKTIPTKATKPKNVSETISDDIDKSNPSEEMKCPFPAHFPQRIPNVDDDDTMEVNMIKTTMHEQFSLISSIDPLEAGLTHFNDFDEDSVLNSN